VAENNQESSGLKPDLECLIDGKRHLIDVSFVYQGENNIETLMTRRYESKLQKYEKCDQING